MLAKWFTIGDDAWRVVVNYDVHPEDLRYVLMQVDRIGVSDRDREEIVKLFDVANHGFTVSDYSERMSLVCIGWSSSERGRRNTIIHEIDHVQHDVCEYYGVPLGSEEAAYVQGTLGEEMMI